jgi:hypothetical protein
VVHVPNDRVSATSPGRSQAAKTIAPVTLRASLIGLHRRAGNRAVAELVRSASARSLQRKVGWSDAVQEGKKWNADEHEVGGIRRIPLEGLPVGLQQGTATIRVWDDKAAKKSHLAKETTAIIGLSPESATARAIVLVPKALNAKEAIEVVVFLHGFTESTGRPFAGWRALSMPKPADAKRTPSAKSKPEGQPASLRHGIDDDDVAPVRDVALDQAEQQLEDSGQHQLVIVLPQGGLHSQFGKAGDKNFDAGEYVKAIVSRLLAEQRWWDADGKAVSAEPDVRRVSMAGHSGAGATLANMANESVRVAKEGASPPGPSSPLTGDLVLFDAINTSDELGAFQAWARMRLDQDLAILKDTTRSEADKLAYLHSAQKLRGYYSNAGYKPAYDELEGAVVAWFNTHASELGQFAPCLRANFTFMHLPVSHEELMRGVGSGQDRSGGILDALRSLHQPQMTTTADCPPMPGRPSKRR